MDWEGISEFVNVAETESFTLAAQRLQISTAKVSRQVSALEKRLNVKLLHRTTRRLSLTEEGQLFYHHCRHVLDGLENAERAVTALQTTPRGRIRLTAPVSYAEKKIAPLLNNFALEYPEIEINAYFTNKQVDLIDEGYDIAIRLGILNDSTLIAKKLQKRDSYLCASPDYLKQYGTPHSVSELEHHNCLLGTLGHWRFPNNSRKHPINLRGTIRYNSGEALLDAALKGLGIVQLPDYYVDIHLAQGTLIAILEDQADVDQGVWVVYPANRYLSPKIRVLIDYLDKYLS